MSEDPYVYSGTTVLKNKLNIHDQSLLEKAEKQLVRKRLEQGIPNGAFNYVHLKAVHRHLFQDIYTWAGKERRVDIAKGNTLFAHTQFIKSSINKQLGKFHHENNLRGLDREIFVQQVAEHYGEINAIHPFREGNGRAQRAFFSLLAQHAGYQLDWRGVERGQWILANEASFNGNNRRLERIFSTITRTLTLDQRLEKQYLQGIDMYNNEPGIER
jgi:cell filamentation protein